MSYGPLRCALRACTLLALFLTPVVGAQVASPERLQQRSEYRAALADLNAGRRAAFSARLNGLEDYPLYPYLLFEDLRRRLSAVPPDQVSAFIDRWADTTLGPRLYRSWLSSLGSRGLWITLLRHWDDEAASGSALLACYRLRALLGTGAPQQAFADAPELWAVGHSQEDACDPVFSAWIAANQVPPEAAARRLRLALKADNIGLANYTVGFLRPEDKATARQLIEVHRNPALLMTLAMDEFDELERLDFVTTALPRLARRDLAAAREARSRFSEVLRRAPERAANIDHILVRAELNADPTRMDLKLPRGGDDSQRRRTLDALAGRALRAHDWQAVSELVGQLREEEQQDPRWRYWAARAASMRGAQDLESLYGALADERHYYGYLAAFRSGRPLQLNQVDTELDPATRSRLMALPGVQRALELYVLNDLTNGRREWRALLAASNSDDQRALAHIARDHGWHRQAIQAALEAGAWNELEIRFPRAWREGFLRHAWDRNIAPSWLYAIARQESAFMRDARSPSGALGLLQLMPATAREVASRNGITLPRSDSGLRRALYEPAMNLRLGSNYLARMFERFDGNRAVAAAAYNAGPSRVSGWLRDHPVSPVDVWIDSIPFNETRNYAQNTLVYAWIYGQMLGTNPPFLYPHEL